MSLAISGSMSAAASTASGQPDAVGLSVLKKGLALKENQNAQLLSSMPQAPRPGGQLFDAFA